MILERIVADNLAELELRKRRLPLEELKRRVSEQETAPLGLADRLTGNDIKLIAEIKKASPSKGVIRAGFDPIAIAKDYVNSGAAAISILTESRYFSGSLDILKQVRDFLGEERPPLLRKDFIYDFYQVYESRYYGADALLLIVAMLDAPKLTELLAMSHQLGMKCLVEVHNENELDIALQSDAQIIGINNRDLKTFNVELSVTERLRPLIPSSRIVVSESGINSREDILKLKRIKVNAVLIGEALMEASDIPAKIRELM